MQGSQRSCLNKGYSLCAAAGEGALLREGVEDLFSAVAVAAMRIGEGEAGENGRIGNMDSQ